MPNLKIYNSTGKEVGEKKLNDSVFGVEINPELVHEVMVSVMANERRPYAHTKTRGNVRGGGKKPWRQKGTGRARHGSRRSPIWVGGGITFGPNKERDYSQKINRRVKQRAMMMSLSDKVAENKMVLVEAFNIKDGKTKESVGLLEKLPIESGKVLIVSPETDKMLRRSIGNLSDVTLRNASDFGLLDILRAEYVVMTPEVIDAIEKKLAAVKA